MLAVGEHLWGRVDPQIQRMASALAGGVGCSLQELCGALSAGALIIGSIYGRTDASQDDEECNRRVSAYRERFLQAFGATCCEEVRASGYGSDGIWPCSVLVGRAARLLLGVID